MTGPGDGWPWDGDADGDGPGGDGPWSWEAGPDEHLPGLADLPQEAEPPLPRPAVRALAALWRPDA